MNIIFLQINIKREYDIKFLGVILDMDVLDENLTLRRHINIIENKYQKILDKLQIKIYIVSKML